VGKLKWGARGHLDDVEGNEDEGQDESDAVHGVVWYDAASRRARLQEQVSRLLPA
jgi:hypothetical protein